MKKIIFAVIGLAMLSTSCIRIVVNNVAGSGEVVTEKIAFEAEGLESLALSSGFDVVLDSSIEPGVVEITTYENIIEFVEVKVDQNTLNIAMRQGNSYNIDQLQARLAPADFRVFAISGGVDLSSVEPLNVDGDMIFSVSGGADVDLKAKCCNLALAVSGGADVDIRELSATDVNVAISGGADVEMSGECNNLSAEVSGGADVDLGLLRAQSVVASASGGADLEVYATASYQLNASGAADIEYHDIGAAVKADATGAADISPVK